MPILLAMAQVSGAKYPPYTPQKSEPDDETVARAMRGELSAATPRDTPKQAGRSASHKSLLDSAFSSEPFGEPDETKKEPDYDKIARSRRVSTGGRDKNQLLFEAAREGEVENLELALRMGANINTQDPLGQTPLHMAAYHGNEAVVEFLVLHGADTDLETEDGLTAYKLAMIEEEKKCAQIIRHRARDVKIAKRVHRRRASQVQALKELRLTAARKREKEESKKAVARKMLNLSRVASMMRKRTKEEAQTKQQIEREKDSRRVAKFAVMWKSRAFGADASKMETSIVESDGKGARQRKIETVMRSAVEAFADGIGGVGALTKRPGAATSVGAKLTSLVKKKLRSASQAGGAAAGGGGSAGALGTAAKPAKATVAAALSAAPAAKSTAPSTPAGTKTADPASTKATAGRPSPADPSATPSAGGLSSMGSLTTASAVRLAAQAAADTPRSATGAGASTAQSTETIQRKESAPKQLAPLLDAAASPAVKVDASGAKALGGTQTPQEGGGGPRRGGRRLVPSTGGAGGGGGSSGSVGAGAVGMVPTPPQGPRSTGSQASATSGAGRSPRVGFAKPAGSQAAASHEPVVVEATPEQLLKSAGGESSVYGLDRVEQEKEAAGRKTRVKLATSRILGMGKLWRRAFHAAHSDFAELLMGAIRAGTTDAAEQYGEEVVRTWLGAMGMGVYAEALLECGFNSMETISLLEPDDMGMVTDQLEESHELWKAQKSAGSAKGPEPPRKMKPAHIKYILAAASDLQEAMDAEELSNLALHTTDDGEDEDDDGFDGEAATEVGTEAEDLAALIGKAEGALS